MSTQNIKKRFLCEELLPFVMGIGGFRKDPVSRPGNTGGLHRLRKSGMVWLDNRAVRSLDFSTLINVVSECRHGIFFSMFRMSVVSD
jgi:hypothetical protein